MRDRRRGSARGARALWLVLILCACGPVRLVSAYDEIIDRGVSDLHTKVVSFVARMVTESGKPEGTYEPNAAFYDDAKAAISTLRLRARLQDKNEDTVKLIDLLDSNMDLLRHLHEMGKEHGLSKALADPALAAIETNFESILKFEVAKKRGEPSPTN